MRSLNRGLVVGEGELVGHQMKEGVEAGEEVRRMMALGVEVVRLSTVREAAGERWIVARGVEEVHLIEAKEEAGARFLYQVVEGQDAKKLEVMEERSKMGRKVFWEAMVEEEYLLEEQRGHDRETAVMMYLVREAEVVVLGLVWEFWEVVQ